MKLFLLQFVPTAHFPLALRRKLHISHHNKTNQQNRTPIKTTYIGDEAFRSSGISCVTIPASVISFGNRAFYQCGALTSATFAAGATVIGTNAFYDCPSLTAAVIPTSVTNIGVQAFRN